MFWICISIAVAFVICMYAVFKSEAKREEKFNRLRNEFLEKYEKGEWKMSAQFKISQEQINTLSNMIAALTDAIVDQKLITQGIEAQTILMEVQGNI